MNGVARRNSIGLYAPAMFLGAFLIFQVQPIVSKHILPWYGGTPGVWTTCLVVFQTLLFAGYAYAHLSIDRLGRRAQASVHIVLLMGAAAVSVLPPDSWKPTGDENPLLRIVSMLLLTVGLPYFVLSATGPLLQAWFWRANPGRSPYPLYALSNAGSLLALASYPFLVEPVLTLHRQAAVWWVLFAIFGLLCAASAWVMVRTGADSSADRTEFGPAGGVADETVSRARWIAWSACGVILFMSVTNQMSLNVASVPFLWLMPLGIYLLTFIIAFSGSRWYSRTLFTPLLVGALTVLYLLIRAEVHFGEEVLLAGLSIGREIAIYVGALFVLCMVCHGELYRSRPSPARLTSFYLYVALGGSLGGIVVGVVAPYTFLLYQELHLGMLGCGLMLLLSATNDPDSRLYRGKARLFALAGVAGVLLLAVALAYQTTLLLKDTPRIERNFFGLLRVREANADDPSRHSLRLFDGAVLHGSQFVATQFRRIPTAYYGIGTGIGQLLLDEPAAGRRVGIVGLGAGTLAAYGRDGDMFRFYEINPDVVDVATTSFTFLEDSPATVDVVLGDARLRLEDELDQGFDVLVLDAFSSDSVPVHLLTAEAFRVYDRHLAPGGILAVHVSNLHLDLTFLVDVQSRAADLHSILVSNRNLPDRASYYSQWAFVARDQVDFDHFISRIEPLVDSGEMRLQAGGTEDHATIRPWTDDYSNLYRILK